MIYHCFPKSQFAVVVGVAISRDLEGNQSQQVPPGGRSCR